MGWLRDRYDRAYFLHEDEQGHPLPYGVAGLEEWKRGDMFARSKRILEQLAIAGGRVLDVGFGRGEALRYCLQRGASHVAGIDFSAAAVAIATETLRDFASDRFRLVEGDALDYFRESPTGTFRHVLMLDAIEHIPRAEVEEMLPGIAARLEPGGCLVISTPFFPEDDDVLGSGGEALAPDPSDEFEATRGMHVNRYTEQSLRAQLGRHGLVPWSHELFLKPLRGLPIWRYPGPGRGWLARRMGYPLRRAR